MPYKEKGLMCIECMNRSGLIVLAGDVLCLNCISHLYIMKKIERKRNSEVLKTKECVKNEGN